MGKSRRERGVGKNKRPILVTGAMRSGTTWVDGMIAFSPRVQYIHEPFVRREWNYLLIRRHPFEEYFPYVTEGNAMPETEEFVKNSLGLSYNLSREVGSVSSLRGFARMALRLMRYCRIRLFNRIPLQ
jgi:hypothetical protein